MTLNIRKKRLLTSGMTGFRSSHVFKRDKHIFFVRHDD